MYAGINYFDNKEFFSKVEEVSKPGTVLLCVNDYFYDAGGAGMNLPIHLPWLHTLFTKDQLIGLYEKYFSVDASEYLKLAYYYPNSHINQAELSKNAKSFGFHEIHSKRTPNISLPSLGHNISRIGPLYNFFNEYRPDLNVKSSDFGTYYNTQVFVKH